MDCCVPTFFLESLCEVSSMHGGCSSCGGGRVVAMTAGGDGRECRVRGRHGGARARCYGVLQLLLDLLLTHLRAVPRLTLVLHRCSVTRDMVC